MALTPELIKELWERDHGGLARAFTEALSDFGYPVTAEWVEAEIQRLFDGGEPKGGPSMFINGWLKEGLE